MRRATVVMQPLPNCGKPIHIGSFKRILSITPDREDAEDALQDTFLSAYLMLRSFEGKSRLSSWLTGTDRGDRVISKLPRIVDQTKEPVMFCGMLEVNPKSGQFDIYFGMVKMLQPQLEKIDGFVVNDRYASLTRPGWLLSLSSWRDEKSLVRWSVETHHHKIMQAARDRVFADYHMHIGEFVADTRVPAGQTLLQQRLDITEAGIGKAITLLNAKCEPDWVKQANADAVAKSLSFDSGTAGVVAWDVFDAVTTPGDVIAFVKWGDLANAEAFARDTTLPEGVRLRNVRIIRDYGMFDRREAPQYFAEVHPKAGSDPHRAG